MPKINIVRQKVINAPIDNVYYALSHMSTWKKWSPWLIMDPEAKVDVSDDEKFYSWSGKRTGEGNMQITKENKNKYVEYNLTFLKPWKSKAKVTFTTNTVNEGTEVTWSMDSNLPWFMFWMKKQMVAFVGNDYERGLNMLKDYVEDDNVHSSLHWTGESDFLGCQYLGMRRTCSIEDMPKLMEADFSKLITYAMSNSGANIHKAFNQYHKFDFIKGIVDYTAGVPFDTFPNDTPPEFIKGSLGATKLYTLEHTGPYHHLGNAWSTMYNMHRNKEIKVKKGYHPFETYGNSPKNTDPKDLITYINFAVK